MEKKGVCQRLGLLRLVLMGVSGCGKSSIGTALSVRIGIPYLEGDELHPATNRARVAAGLPLRDMDRWPWLDLIAARLARQAPLIVGCSALRRAYREHLRVQAGGVVS